MNKNILTLLVAGLLAISLANGQGPTTWRGPGSTGKFPDTGLLKTWPVNGPAVLWHYDELGEGYSSPVFANGKIYLSGETDGVGYISSLTNDGTLEWKAPYGEEWVESYPGSRSTPTVVGDMLYILSGKGAITCMNSANGNVNWKKDITKDLDGVNIKWGFTETLVVDGNKIFVTPGGEVNNVVALNRLNGQLIWSSKGVGDKSAYCTPLIVKLPTRKLLVTMMENHILGLNAETGDLLWSFEQTNRWAVHANTPLYYDNGLFCFSGYGQGGVKLDLNDDGSEVTKGWFSKKLDSRMGGAVVVDGYIYCSGDNTRDWQCTDWKTGEQKYASQEIAKGNLVYADGMLFIYSEKGELAMVPATPNEFKITGQTMVELRNAQHWAHLMIDKGRLFVRNGKTLIAYKIN